MLCAFNPEWGLLSCSVKAYGNASKHLAKTGNKKWEEGKVFLLVEVSVYAGLKCSWRLSPVWSVNRCEGLRVKIFGLDLLRQWRWCFAGIFVCCEKNNFSVLFLYPDPNHLLLRNFLTCLCFCGFSTFRQKSAPWNLLCFPLNLSTLSLFLKINFSAQLAVALRITSFRMLWTWLLLLSLDDPSSLLSLSLLSLLFLLFSWACKALLYLPSVVFYPSLNFLLIFSSAFIFGTCIPSCSWFVTIILRAPIFQILLSH